MELKRMKRERVDRELALGHGVYDYEYQCYLDSDGFVLEDGHIDIMPGCIGCLFEGVHIDDVREYEEV